MRDKIVNKIFFILIIVYIILYSANANGYYEYSNYSKKSLTDTQIRKFESDVLNGNKIDMNDYMVKEIDYSNNLSKDNVYISKSINYVFKEILKKTLGFLNKIIE